MILKTLYRMITLLAITMPLCCMEQQMNELVLKGRQALVVVVNMALRALEKETANDDIDSGTALQYFYEQLDNPSYEIPNGRAKIKLQEFGLIGRDGKIDPLTYIALKSVTSAN